MRLVSLNVWGGKLYDKLNSFLTSKSHEIDIFCFQEMLHQKAPPSEDGWKDAVPNLYDKFVHTLNDFDGYITKPYSLLGERMAIFASERINVEDNGEIILCEERKMEVNGRPFSMQSKLQWISFTNEGKQFTVANVHGIWMKGNKGDTPERIDQSQKILSFLDSRVGYKLLCGDFNLIPDTQSVKILDKSLENLIKKYGITSTRSSLYFSTNSKFADYVFVSKEIAVSKFEILQDVVSDHLPLMTEFH